MKFCPACTSKYDDTLSFCPNDGEVLEEDPHSFVGSVLDGQYQIETLLGRGGMGAVYRARHILLGDRVAIKMLPPEMRSNAEWLRRFQREGQAARRFRHPNAVTVYDLRTSSDGMIYLVMEYVEGTTLDAELKKRGRFSPAEALATLKPVLSVLNAAHAMGVVHRDLKPENIMIGKAGTGGEPIVKLLDLGIAKLREVAGAEKTGSTNLTVAGQMLGTPYYMSPEQWGELPEDGSSEIDGRADIYSLGVVFYEIISGKRPFSGVTILELRKQHVTLTAQPLHEVASNVPVDFGKALMRAMAKDRGDRQAAAGELEKELEASLAEADAAPTALFVAASAPADKHRFATVAARPTPTMGDPGAMTVVDGGAAEPAQSQAATMPTVVVDADKIAARRAAQPAEIPPPTPRAQVDIPIQSRRGPRILVGAMVLLLVLGAAGYAVINFMGKKSLRSSSTPPSEPEISLPKHELGRYWVEFETENKDEQIIAGDSIVLDTNKAFRFHFSPNQSGYLYIIGPNRDNTSRTMYLTAQPGKFSGLKSNEIKSGLDFGFPLPSQTHTNWLRAGPGAGTEVFTFVFSLNPISDPQFFAGPSERDLTPEEEKELDNFRRQNGANEVDAEIIKNGAFPMTSVRVPQNKAATAIFSIKLSHK